MYLYSCVADENFTQDPTTRSDALDSYDSSKWKRAMDEEMESLRINDTWKLVDLPEGKNVVESKWVFKTKKGNDHTQKRHKARLVAKGYTQIHGIDYKENFAPVVRHSTIRMLIALAAEIGLDIYHWDVTTAFLNGKLHEEIYMQQPEGYVEQGKESKVCRLLKTIYGLKQLSRAWNEEIDQAMKGLGFKRSALEPCVYYKIEKDLIFISALYVDDFFHFVNDKRELMKVKDVLSTKYKMKDLGEAKECLGIRIARNCKAGTIKLDQEEFVEQILQKFNMTDCKPIGTPLEPKKKLMKSQDGEQIKSPSVPYQNLVGSLMYLATCTRPDIAHAASVLSQFNTCYTEEHWQAAKRVLRYLRGTSKMCLTYSKSETVSAYVDADWAGDEGDRRSYTGYVFMLGGAAINWESKKQPTVTLSTTEAEYMALAEAAKEAVHRRNIFF